MSNKIDKILLVNDLHIGKSNIHEFIANWEEMIDVCLRHDVEHVAIGGDLWQSRSSQTLSVLLTIKDAFNAALNSGIKKFYVAAGNHDKVDQSEPHSYNHLFASHDIECIDYDKVVRLDDGKHTLDLHIFSYFPESQFKNVFEEALRQHSDARLRIAYVHEGIRGGRGQESEDEMPASVFEDFDKVYAGHYHDRNAIANSNVEYIGSSRQMNFGEDELKGYTILHASGKADFVQNRVNLRYKTFEVKADLAEEGDWQQKALDILSDERYRVRVRVHSPNSHTVVDKQKLYDLGIHKVEVSVADLIPTEEVSSALSVKYDNQGLCDEYRKFCDAKKVADVELGLKFIKNQEALCGH